MDFVNTDSQKRWVESQSYEGPDRRVRRLVRIWERRRQDTSDRLPALSTMLRQLRVMAMAADTARGREHFSLRATAFIALAQLHGRPDVASAARRMLSALEANASDPRVDLERQIDAIISDVATS